MAVPVGAVVAVVGGIVYVAIKLGPQCKKAGISIKNIFKRKKRSKSGVAHLVPST